MNFAPKRYVYMISDGTGLTVESLTNSLLTQFQSILFEKIMFPYVDSVEKVNDIVQQIQTCIETKQSIPLVFMTVVNPEWCKQIKRTKAQVYDLLNTFLEPLEVELGAKSSDIPGLMHSVNDEERYLHRIEAINFALMYDDGVKPRDYDRADIILIGASRTGKTPSCLYMALQFGILAANYPITEEDLGNHALPAVLKPVKQKLFGLTIDPERLQFIRQERRPNSTYATASQCRREVTEIETIFVREQIPYLNSTHCSIEEIATKIMSITGIKRRIF